MGGGGGGAGRPPPNVFFAQVDYIFSWIKMTWKP